MPGHRTELFTPYKGMGIQEGHDAARVGATEKWALGGWGWKRRTAKGQGSPNKGGFNPPLRTEQPIPALSRTEGLTNRFMPLAGGSAFLQPLSPFLSTACLFFFYFYGRGTRGGS